MTRPAISGSTPPGPRMPESVLRRRPAEIVVRPQPRSAPAGVPARRPSPRPAVAARPIPRPGPAARPWARPAPPARRPVAPPARRPVPLGLMAAILVFVGLFTVGAGLGAATGFDLGELFRGPDKPPPRAFPVLDPSPPRRLTIPSIKVEAPILHVGRAKDGSVDVPPLNRHDEAGWFDQGPTPGQFGPALIVGHADTRSGPSVFAGLGKLKAGQKIEVLREDDSVAIFQINSVEHFHKEKLPVKRVYGDYSRPSLRLMTCGGRWLGGEQGYSDNVVVFASLVSAKDT
ncbi:hypothetical protein Aau02nite_37980 [Amorphoplanes auranticolor]|uniref:Sortase family protein n=1 Tax=Actinoplanes auranticolor TaxID=47988 RepID=A0A919SDT0_9ACTN|nr:class F sortase [Actinoplanes auranticolor]GIM69827.1 hypothetical protein Aau02nite_37980 [Actinoplanes auranticolor]